MGCFISSPHSSRRYRDPADFDEEIVPDDVLPLRTFGNFRNSSVFVPDDIPGLPSTHFLGPHLATDPDTLLYEAEIDNGRAWRCIRPALLLWLCPFTWPVLVAQGLSRLFQMCTCDEACYWLRKEYSTRTFYRVYPNRIEVNNPSVRIPWGLCACGSWNADNVLAHPFDRGAFGFRRVQCGVLNYLCLTWPVYGDAVARQRCPCNGSLLRGGWWCEEWPCDVMCCTYRYYGLADGDETAFASSLALQAYFEGRKINTEDMKQCVEYWRNNISELSDPVSRKRDVMCEPFYIPCCQGHNIYNYICNCKRSIPYGSDDKRTAELKEVYDKYEKLRKKQVETYETFKGPIRNSTVCRTLGCRRVLGRKGLCFCSEGCNDTAGCCYKDLEMNSGDPFPPHSHPDIDDENDAAKILQIVLGNPPPNVVYKRWERNDVSGKFQVVTYPATLADPKNAAHVALIPAADNKKGSLVQRAVSSTAIETEMVETDVNVT